MIRYFKLFIFFVLIGVYSCSKESDNIFTQLSLVEDSIPDKELSMKGGSFEIEVEWANTRWKVFGGAVLQGQQFISETTPQIGGSPDGGPERTTVTVEFLSNKTHEINSQELVLSSLDGQYSERVVLNQSPLGDEPFELVVNPEITYQTIAGFGGANTIWGSDYLNSNEMELAFGTDEGLGLSIFRVRLSSNKNDWAGLVNVIKDANERGVKVLASPWSPPAKWKSNNSINGGGFLKYEHYNDFADYINEFIDFMNSKDAVIDVVSVQNEPDIEVGYEGCEYTIKEMYDFVKNHTASITGAKLMAAESFNFKHSYTDDILNDPDAAKNLDIIGFHTYGSGRHPYPLAVEKGKELWMTEHLLNLDSGNIPENWTSNTNPKIIWDETMDFLLDIHDGMSYNWNAYIWWYIRRYYSFLGDGTNGTQRGEILKRGYAMSQYSKFIRPGYERINADFTFSIEGIKVTAYKGDGKIIAVIINTTDFDNYSVELITPGSVKSVFSYTTSLDLNRSKKELNPDNGKVLFEMPSKSIITVELEY